LKSQEIPGELFLEKKVERPNVCQCLVHLLPGTISLWIKDEDHIAQTLTLLLAEREPIFNE
jgi:hypothetical protein